LIHGELVLGGDGNGVSIIVWNLSLSGRFPSDLGTLTSPDIGGSLISNISFSSGFPNSSLISGERMLFSDGSWVSIIVWDLSLSGRFPSDLGTLTSPDIGGSLTGNISNSRGFKTSSLIHGELVLGGDGSGISIIWISNFSLNGRFPSGNGTLTSPDIGSSLTSNSTLSSRFH